MIKIVVTEMPDKLSNGIITCPFARRDYKAVGYGTWHWCSLVNGLCDLDYGNPCSYLTTKDALIDKSVI